MSAPNKAREWVTRRAKRADSRALLKPNRLRKQRLVEEYERLFVALWDGMAISLSDDDRARFRRMMLVDVGVCV